MLMVVHLSIMIGVCWTGICGFPQHLIQKMVRNVRRWGWSKRDHDLQLAWPWPFTLFQSAIWLVHHLRGQSNLYNIGLVEFCVKIDGYHLTKQPTTNPFNFVIAMHLFLRQWSACQDRPTIKPAPWLAMELIVPADCHYNGYIIHHLFTFIQWCLYSVNHQLMMVTHD